VSHPVSDQIRVLLIDDSAVVRGFITRILEADPDIKVVGSAQNGEVGVSQAASTNPDIILLDVEMPVMDGLTAIPHLMSKSPQSKIIMCSTLTIQNGATALKAMSLGAVDCIAKPTSVQDIYSQEAFRTLLLHKIKSIAEGSRPRSSSSRPDNKEISQTKSVHLHPTLPKDIKLRDPKLGHQGKPAILAVGSSTGGPNALFAFLKNLVGLDIPIVITQHMPPTFTKILAEHITQQTGIKAIEASEGSELIAGEILVAPGGHHMTIVAHPTTGKKIVKLDDGPMENFCKPAVDPMLRSLIPLYGEKIFTVILTGMGNDGFKGSQQVIEAGGRVIAQDEATSVVWGMPGAVALGGLCTAVLPLNEIGPYTRKQIMRV
jgi:two-component system chemotaxis response regulator CheB